MSITVVRCSTWYDLKYQFARQLFGDGPFRRGAFVFRGQRRAAWPLIPSFDRLIEQRLIKCETSERQQVLDEMIESFRLECEALDLAETTVKDELKILALGQHYGLPTRLLDWSESPYISAYFAFSDCLLANEVEDEAAVWALRIDHEIWRGDRGVTICKVPSFDNIRLRNQNGRFTYSKTPFVTLEEFVLFCPRHEGALYQFTVPQCEAVQALPDLDMMGITPSRLFPGTEGAASAARLRMMYEHHKG